ncbi:hypothetical protein AXG93_3012s1010 [Marchantia polymorpha subsp. ruderalis]|uniref:Uncharacterized protein n=1 Tax=Marchantia polymorpha subsp. ruderalis TaxID=1480154 RepID=A0A176VD46_MARPO|nr:hypothetical protein AXG93_3012s1010 [Marchantia polymorpha subsp. ruderalis]
MVTHEDERRSSEEDPKNLVVAFPDFLQDSVVPFLKYLDGKRDKYAMLKEAGFFVKLVSKMTHIKGAAAMKTAKEMKKECAEATAKITKRVASFNSECATMMVTLQERDEHLWAKEMECEVFWLNLAKKKKLWAAEQLRTKDCDRLRAKLKTVEEYLEMLRIKAEAVELAF